MDPQLDNAEKNKILIKRLPHSFIYCFVGVVATVYIQSIHGGKAINAIVASSLVGLIVAFFTITIDDEHKLSWAAFCGSFAGMLDLSILADNHLYTSLYFLFNVLALALLTSLLYALVEYLSRKFPRVFFDGYGGKLGTTAFISVLIFILFKKIFFHSNIHIFDAQPLKDIFQWWQILVILSAIIGALISMEIKGTVSSLNDNYKVLTVATTGLIGGILVYQIPPAELGAHISAAWYIGAFVGMSSYFILMLRRDYFITGVISGVIFVLTMYLFVGVGGKLGFLSFLSVLIMRIIFTVFKKLTHLRDKSVTEVIESIQHGEEIADQTVDDTYAQALVESLLAAQQEAGEGGDTGGGAFDAGEDELPASFVIPESGTGPSDGDYQEQFVMQDDSYASIPEAQSAVNLDYLSASLQSIVEFFNYLSINNWVYMYKNEEHVYEPLAYQGITGGSIFMLKFNEKSKFIVTLEGAHKSLAFTGSAIRQKIFEKRFSPADLDNAHALLIYPIRESEQLQGFFILLDKNETDEAALQNIRTIKKHFDENFDHDN